jgi:hypothetical protein
MEFFFEQIEEECRLVDAEDGIGAARRVEKSDDREWRRSFN